jgi:hypothetical protein
MVRMVSAAAAVAAAAAAAVAVAVAGAHVTCRKPKECKATLEI